VASNNNSYASLALGKLYFDGTAVEKNDKLSFEYITKANNAGNPASILPLAKCYHNGIGVQVNNRNALFLCEQSARNGDIKGKIRFGKYHYKGFGTAKNVMAALRLVWEVTREGHSLPSYFCDLYLGIEQRKHPDYVLKMISDIAKASSDNSSQELDSSLLPSPIAME
jgi:TPR repeat protein